MHILWHEMSYSSLQAAKTLRNRGLWRSSVSRSYYAAYTAVAGAVARRGLVFAGGRINPTHSQLAKLIDNESEISQSTRRRIKQNVRMLWKARVDADYSPVAQIGRTEAISYLRAATSVLKDLGVL